jgi:hypothetical protein
MCWRSRHDPVVPCDPIRPAKPDSHFEDEYSAALDLEIPVALIEHDVAGSFGASCKKVPKDSGEAIYRGWMMRPEAYQGFELALSQRGTVLRTNPSSYRNAHHLPQSYEAVKEDTPQSVGRPPQTRKLN